MRTALLEMRTAAQGTRTAKSMRINEWWKWTFWEKNFTIQTNCPMQSCLSRQLTPKAPKESSPHSSQMKKPTTSKQAAKKTAFPDELIDN